MNHGSIRALADVMVTAAIFAVCARRYLASGGRDDIKSLNAGIRAPRRTSHLHLGRHRGTPSADVPEAYSAWLTRGAELDPDVRCTVAGEIDRRRISAA